MSSIRPLTPELAKKAQEELGEVPSRIDDDLKALKEWLSKQSHIVARTDDQWLIAFLRGCKYSLERTKEKLDFYYTMRTMIPEMTSCVDPADKDFQDFVRLGSCIVLPKPINKTGPTVVIIRPGAYNSNKYGVEDNIKLGNMITTIMMLENDNTIVSGERGIIDLKNVDMGHFVQMTPTTIKKMVMCNEKSLPIRQKGFHHVNSPPGIETIFSLFQKLMSKKNNERMKVHTNFEELYDDIPKEILPTEYGGDAGPISEIAEYWIQKLLTYRDYFLEEAKYKSIESKRPGKPQTAEGLFGVEGSFRQLSVD